MKQTTLSPLQMNDEMMMMVVVVAVMGVTMVMAMTMIMMTMVMTMMVMMMIGCSYFLLWIMFQGLCSITTTPHSTCF